MQCDDFEQVIERSGLVQLPEAACAHAAGCPSCRGLLADFAAMVAAAHEIPAEVDPPARVWVAVRAQLEAEGIIRKPAVAVIPEKAPWWRGLNRLVASRMLATAAVAALILAVGLLRYAPHSNPPVRSMPEPFADTASTLDQEERSLGPMQTASTLAVSPVDNSLRENLATVNAFIKECRKRLEEDPNDQMARDYLSTAYQQKAEILAAMMERGRSVN
jgi:hypothetical protein